MDTLGEYVTTWRRPTAWRPRARTRHAAASRSRPAHLSQRGPLAPDDASLTWHPRDGTRPTYVYARIPLHTATCMRVKAGRLRPSPRGAAPGVSWVLHTPGHRASQGIGDPWGHRRRPPRGCARVGGTARGASGAPSSHSPSGRGVAPSRGAYSVSHSLSRISRAAVKWTVAISAAASLSRASMASINFPCSSLD
jgi:hypothetical protein